MQLVIFDTEFTAWPGSNLRNWSEPWEHREVIQLAALLVEIDQQGITTLASFNELVKPSINSQLSQYITELTGISQEMVDNLGIDFCSALSSFHQFCQQGQVRCLAWGQDQHILRENCQLNQINMPNFSEGFGNLQQIIKQLNNPAWQCSSGELASHLGLKLKGHNHNALHDVRSIAMALDTWMQAQTLREQDLH